MKKVGDTVFIAAEVIFCKEISLQFCRMSFSNFRLRVVVAYAKKRQEKAISSLPSKYRGSVQWDKQSVARLPFSNLCSFIHGENSSCVTFTKAFNIN